MSIDTKRLQQKLGVTADGIFGLNSYTALFQNAGASLDRAQELAICANAYFVNYGMMVSANRLAHFMAQLIHESGSFRYMEEIASGKAYEGRSDLGNTQPGDGARYKGRGPIQITGRFNYRAFGRKLGLDIERHPEMASFPSMGLLLGLEYWDEHHLNALADNDDLLGITRAINGGTNGLDGRKAALTKMKALVA